MCHSMLVPLQRWPSEEVAREAAKRIYTKPTVGSNDHRIAGRPHGGMMLGGTLSFLGPSTLLSTIFRASSNACAGVGMG